MDPPQGHWLRRMMEIGSSLTVTGLVVGVRNRQIIQRMSNHGEAYITTVLVSESFVFDLLMHVHSLTLIIFSWFLLLQHFSDFGFHDELDMVMKKVSLDSPPKSQCKHQPVERYVQSPGGDTVTLTLNITSHSLSHPPSSMCDDQDVSLSTTEHTHTVREVV